MKIHGYQQKISIVVKWYKNKKADKINFIMLSSDSEKEIETPNKKQKLSNLTFTPITIIYAILFFSLFLIVDAEIILKGKYNYCIETGAELVDMTEACISTNDIVKPETPDKTQYILTILHKRKNLIDGYGYQCKAEDIIVTAISTFLNEQTYSTKIIEKDLSIDDCKYMAFTNMCYGKKMECENGVCSHKREPKPDYRWWSTTTSTGESCLYFKRKLIGQSEDSILIQTTDHSCKYSNMHCKIHHAIVIWDNTIKHDCPYEIVNAATFEAIDSHLYVSKQSNLLFQTTKTFRECDIKITGTSEGLFLAKQEDTLNFERAEIDVNIQHELTLAEIDSNKFNFINLYRKITQALCFNGLNVLQSYRQFDDLYFKFYNYKGQTTIYYTNKGEIYLPRCKQIETIKVLTNLTNCYQDVPIIIQETNKTITAFLQPESILRATSKITNCDAQIQMLFDEASNKVIERKDTKIKTHEKSAIHFTQHTFLDRIAEQTNYQHFSTLLEETDVLSQFLNLTRIIEANGETLNVKPDELKSEHTFRNTVEKVRNQIDEIKSSLFYLAGVMIAIIITLILIIITFKLCTKTNKKKFINRFNKRNIRETILESTEPKSSIELQPLKVIKEEVSTSIASAPLFPQLPTLEKKEEINDSELNKLNTLSIDTLRIINQVINNNEASNQAQERGVVNNENITINETP